MTPRKRSPGHLQRRGDSFRVRLSVAGERHEFTIRTDDRRAAELFARKKHEELERARERRDLGLEGGVRFSALLAKFAETVLPTVAPGTAQAYRESMLPLRSFFVEQLRDPAVETIQAKHVTEFLAWRRVHRLNGTAPLSNRTLAKDRAVLHRIFELADSLEYRDGNPVARTDAPKSDKLDPVLLTSSEYERFIAACADRPMLRTYVIVLAEAGLRADSEALFLRWEDIDFEGGFLWVASGRHGHRTKSGKGRWVPMTSRLRETLRDHAAAYRLATYQGKRSPWVFHHESSGAGRVPGARIGSLYHGYVAAAARAKLPDALRQHDLRHRRVTLWLAEGKNPVHVMEAMGHSDLRVTMEYTHLAREHLRALVDQPIAPQQNRSQA